MASNTAYITVDSSDYLVMWPDKTVSVTLDTKDSIASPKYWLLPKPALPTGTLLLFAGAFLLGRWSKKRR